MMSSKKGSSGYRYLLLCIEQLADRHYVNNVSFVPSFPL